MNEIIDPEVRILAGLSQTLALDYQSEKEDPWLGSPFAWIRTRPSRQRGAIGEQLVAGWCAARGCDVLRSHGSEYDRVINGHRVEVKFSTLWESGVYKFQQIRDQEYDLLLCLGVSPWDAGCWVIPKAVLFDYVIGHTGQHTGASGTDTAWLSFPSTAPHEWLKPHGGTLSEAWRVLQGFGSGTH